MTERAIPTPDHIVGAAIDEIVSRRPAALSYFNGQRGQWHALKVAWRAQATRNIQRLADELLCSRLKFAADKSLRELAASEFFLDIEEEQTKAIGFIRITRPTPGAPTPGVIRQGTKFARRPNPAAVPLPIQAAEYVSTEPVIVPGMEVTVTVPIEAVRPGSHANTPWETGVGPSTQGLAISDSLFATFTPSLLVAAGGRGSLEDDDIRRIATEQPRGLVGPTIGALIATALRSQGVKYFAELEDTTNAISVMALADPSWAMSDPWSAKLLQILRDNAEGFGCRTRVAGLENTFIQLDATVQLKSKKFTAYTAEISANMRKAARAYFDDRMDWYVWKTKALRAALTRSDPRIFTCTSVTVSDRNGNVLAEPSDPLPTAETFTHYYLPDNALTVTFQNPV